MLQEHRGQIGPESSEVPGLSRYWRGASVVKQARKYFATWSYEHIGVSFSISFGVKRKKEDGFPSQESTLLLCQAEHVEPLAMLGSSVHESSRMMMMVDDFEQTTNGCFR